MRTFFPTLLVAALLLSGCSAGLTYESLSHSPSSLQPSVRLQINPLPLTPRSEGAAQTGAQSRPCTGSFVEHQLPHITGTAFERVTYFTSNGAGLAVGDLDNDGDEDFVLANLLGPNQIFWNEGDWKFRPQILLDGSLRGLALVDVDGDGWLDISATSRSGISPLLAQPRRRGQCSALHQRTGTGTPTGCQRLRLLAAVGRPGR